MRACLVVNIKSISPRLMMSYLSLIAMKAQVNGIDDIREWKPVRAFRNNETLVTPTG